MTVSCWLCAVMFLSVVRGISHVMAFNPELFNHRCVLEVFTSDFVILLGYCPWSDVHCHEIFCPTNEMQFTDRELFYTDRVCRSYSSYGPSTLLYNPYVGFPVRTNSTDRNHSLTVRYGAGVVDNPPKYGRHLFSELACINIICLMTMMMII